MKLKRVIFKGQGQQPDTIAQVNEDDGISVVLQTGPATYTMTHRELQEAVSDGRATLIKGGR